MLRTYFKKLPNKGALTLSKNIGDVKTKFSQRQT